MFPARQFYAEGVQEQATPTRMRAVFHIPADGMSPRGKLYPYLVCASGDQVDAQQAAPFFPVQAKHLTQGFPAPAAPDFLPAGYVRFFQHIVQRA